MTTIDDHEGTPPAVVIRCMWCPDMTHPEPDNHPAGAEHIVRACVTCGRRIQRVTRGGPWHHLTPATHSAVPAPIEPAATPEPDDTPAELRFRCPHCPDEAHPEPANHYGGDPRHYTRFCATCGAPVLQARSGGLWYHRNGTPAPGHGPHVATLRPLDSVGRVGGQCTTCSLPVQLNPGGTWFHVAGSQDHAAVVIAAPVQPSDLVSPEVFAADVPDLADVRAAMAAGALDPDDFSWGHFPRERVAVRPLAPARGDAVEAWVKRARDGFETRVDGVLQGRDAIAFDALDDLLDDYRAHADAGTPLDREPVNPVTGLPLGYQPRPPSMDRPATDRERAESTAALARLGPIEDDLAAVSAPTPKWLNVLDGQYYMDTVIAAIPAGTLARPSAIFDVARSAVIAMLDALEREGRLQLGPEPSAEPERVEDVTDKPYQWRDRTVQLGDVEKWLMRTRDEFDCNDDAGDSWNAGAYASLDTLVDMLRDHDGVPPADAEVPTGPAVCGRPLGRAANRCLRPPGHPGQCDDDPPTDPLDARVLSAALTDAFELDGDPMYAADTARSVVEALRLAGFAVTRTGARPAQAAPSADAVVSLALDGGERVRLTNEGAGTVWAQVGRQRAMLQHADSIGVAVPVPTPPVPTEVPEVPTVRSTAIGEAVRVAIGEAVNVITGGASADGSGSSPTPPAASAQPTRDRDHDDKPYEHDHLFGNPGGHHHHSHTHSPDPTPPTAPGWYEFDQHKGWRLLFPLAPTEPSQLGGRAGEWVAWVPAADWLALDAQGRSARVDEARRAAVAMCGPNVVRTGEAPRIELGPDNVVHIIWPTNPEGRATNG